MKHLTMIEAIDKIKSAYHNKCLSIIEKFDISYIDFALIMFFANNKDKTTAKEFCERRDFKANVVSLHVDKLAKEGYLERECHSTDRRKINLSITNKCDKIIKEGHKMQNEFFSKIVNGLSKEELDAFRKSMITILDNVNEL